MEFMLFFNIRTFGFLCNLFNAGIILAVANFTIKLKDNVIKLREVAIVSIKEKQSSITSKSSSDSCLVVVA